MGQGDLFWREQQLLQQATELLHNVNMEESIPPEEYARLLRGYSGLLKQISQLTRLSDKQQKRMSNLLERLSRYVSPPLYKKITIGREKVEINKTRRVKLSIFFSDIKGFSWHSANMEGEELSAILNSYLEEMTRIISKHGGTLDKYIGDAILVFFGDPDYSNDFDHARRCLAMALEMRQRMHELQKQWFELGFSEPLHIRMGIATGYVSVGNFGSSERMDYTIIGAPVNLAARLQAEAGEDQILISHETWSYVKDTICCLGPRQYELKGFYSPILAYEVTGMKELEHCSDIVFEDQEHGIYLRVDQKKTNKSTLMDLLEKLTQTSHEI